MIQAVEISNFKCFKSLHLPELSRLNIIAGRNGVGKTALLEALFIFHDRAAPDLFLKTQAWRGVYQVPADPAQLWGPFFHNFEMDQTMRIRLTADGRTEEAAYSFEKTYSPRSPAPVPAPVLRGELDTVGTSSDSKTVPCIHITYKEAGRPDFHARLYMLDGKLLPEYEHAWQLPRKAVVLHARGRDDPVERVKRLESLINDKQESVVEKFLGLIAPVRDLQVLYTGPTIICDIGLPHPVPVGYAGDGMDRLLRIILAMTDAKGGLVLIDEVENGIHRSVQEPFWRAVADAAVEFDCQVIATTHSHEFLEAAHGATTGGHEQRFRYIRLDREGSETAAHVFTHEMLGTALEANLEVR